MYIALTWDLVVILFCGLICSYSFIVGKHESVKIIIAVYLSIILLHGLMYLSSYVLADMQSLLGMLGIEQGRTVTVVTQLILFVAALLVISLRGGLTLEYDRDLPFITDNIILGVLGILTSFLILSTILSIIAGVLPLDPALATAQSLEPLLLESTLIPILVDFHALWFSLPALVIVVVGVISRSTD